MEKASYGDLNSSGKWQMSFGDTLLPLLHPPPTPWSSQHCPPSVVSESATDVSLCAPLPSRQSNPVDPPLPCSSPFLPSPRWGWGQIIARAPTPGPALACARDTASCGRASPAAGTGSRSSAPPGSGRRCWTPGADETRSKKNVVLSQNK